MRSEFSAFSSLLVTCDTGKSQFESRDETFLLPHSWQQITAACVEPMTRIGSWETMTVTVCTGVRMEQRLEETRTHRHRDTAARDTRPSLGSDTGARVRGERELLLLRAGRTFAHSRDWIQESTHGASRRGRRRKCWCRRFSDELRCRLLPLSCFLSDTSLVLPSCLPRLPTHPVYTLHAICIRLPCSTAGAMHVCTRYMSAPACSQ